MFHFRMLAFLKASHHILSLDSGDHRNFLNKTFIPGIEKVARLVHYRRVFEFNLPGNEKYFTM